MSQDTPKKSAPYSPEVDAVQLLEDPNQESPKKTRQFNRKFAIMAFLGVLALLGGAILMQGISAEQQAMEVPEQNVPVEQLDQTQASQQSAARLADKLAELEREKEALEQAQKSLQEDRAKLADASAPTAAPSSPLAQSLQARTKEQDADGKKQEEDPWVLARKAFRAQDAQAYYQNRFAARRAPLFYATRAPKESQDEDVMPPAEGDSREAFARRLQQGQRRAARSGQAPRGLSNALPQGEAHASLTPSSGVVDGPAQQEQFFYQGGQAQAGYRPQGGVVRTGVHVDAGTVVHLVLETGLSSELPGMLTARVNQPVYDSTLSFVVIPSGSKVLGTYNSRVEEGQTRAQIVWTTLKLESGATFKLPAFPGVELSGQSGVEADVDNHWDKAIAGAALSGVFSATASALAGPTNQLNVNPRQQAIYGAAQPVQEMGEDIAEQFLNLPPTLTLEPGAQVGMLCTSDLLLSN